MNFGILNKQEDIMEENKALPVVKDPFDIKPLEDLFQKFTVAIDAMETEALKHGVSDATSCDEANTMTNQAKKLMQTIEKKRKEVKDPYLKVTSAIDGFAGGLKKRLVSIQAGLNQKLLPYLQEMERRRREEERKAAEEARKEQERLERERQAEIAKQEEIARQKAIAEGKAKKEAERLAKEAAEEIEPAPIVVAPAPVTPDVVETEAGTSKIKTVWDWEIADFAALPPALFEARAAELKKAAAPYINAQMKAGIRAMSGVKFFRKTELKTVTRR